MRKKSFLLILILVFIVFSDSFAQTVQWRGPKRDGNFPSKNLKKMWGPELLLKVDGLGKGHSSVIYHDEMMYITGMKDTLDVLSAVNMEGKVLWETVYGTAWRKSFPDTRSTPTLSDGKLYVTSGVGELVCLDAKNGKILWKVNVDKDYKGEWSRFGVSESPLVYKNIVISCPGGNENSIVAFDKNTGKEVWKTDSIGGKRIYSSPTLYEHDGKVEILAFTSKHLVCLDPVDGKVQWDFENPFKKYKDGPYTNTPIYQGNEIFVSHGYDYPAFMLKVSPDSVYMKWVDTIFDNHHHGYVLHDGYIYGSNWESNKKGKWICMDWETGRIKFEYDWGTKGTIIAADSMFYIYEEKSGMIGLLKPNPSKFDLQSSFKITEGSGPHWAHLSIYNNMLFVRHGEVLMVYKI